MKPGDTVTLSAEQVHVMSNHFTVILGFVELMLAETPPDHPRYGDLEEIRSAAVQAAEMIGRRLR